MAIKRVLVCEDELHIARLIQVNLERQGYEVRCTVESSNAIELLSAGGFDLLVLNPEMPEAESVRRQAEAQHVKVISRSAARFNG